jgi:hypothetical protein
MPSVNNAGINFTTPAFLYQMQNPLPAINFTVPAFLYQVANPANAAYLTEPAVTFGDQTSSDAVLLSSGTTTNVVATVNYYQRVFSSGLNVWCYYTTQNGIDTSPLSVATNPNWTGSIAAYELVTTSAV